MFTIKKNLSLLVAVGVFVGGVSAGAANAQEPRTVTLDNDGKVSKVSTTSDSIDEFLAEQKVAVREGKTRVSPSRGSALESGAVITVRQSKNVTLTRKRVSTVHSTYALTVAQFLRERGIKVDRLDRVSPSRTAALTDGARVRFVDVRQSFKSAVKKKRWKTRYKKSSTLYKGQKKVAQRGKPRRTRVTRRYIFEDNVLKSKRIVKRRVISKGRPKIILKGTKERGPSGVWKRLAECESGGNPRAVNPAGYYGLYQFSLATWNSVGGKGNPANASPAEQTKRAKILQKRSGWGQWPACSIKIGVR